MKSRNPAIIHLPLEISGQVGLLCRFLRRLGVTAEGYSYFPSYLNYEYIYNTDLFELVKALPAFIHEFDIFHFHHSLTLMEDFRDLLWLKEAGKKVIMHHHGDDVRLRDKAQAMNPYVNTDSSRPDQQIRKNLALFAKSVDAAVVQDYEINQYVLPFYQESNTPVHIMPRLVDCLSLSPYPPGKTKVPLIVHAPTNRIFKGSEYVEKAIQEVKKHAVLRYIAIEGKSHQETMKLLQTADIVIDQVLCGAYGNVSLEAMAMGKAVICYIHPDYLPNYPPSLPIISANPETLAEKLLGLVNEPRAWAELGHRGRLYVEEHHDAAKVAAKFLDLYRSIWR